MSHRRVEPTLPCVIAVCASLGHGFSKQVRPSITLVSGIGVADDAHAGVTVRHRSRVAVDPSQPNLRQVHLVHRALFDELAAAGFAIAPGEIGENVTTEGIDLLALPRETRLQLGDRAVVEVTGLRNPCAQLDRHRAGLMKAVLPRNSEGHLVRKAGVMAIVLTGGTVRAGDAITIHWPAGIRKPLACV